MIHTCILLLGNRSTLATFNLLERELTLVEETCAEDGRDREGAGAEAGGGGGGGDEEEEDSNTS